jgi:hypothetical protein
MSNVGVIIFFVIIIGIILVTCLIPSLVIKNNFAIYEDPIQIVSNVSGARGTIEVVANSKPEELIPFKLFTNLPPFDVIVSCASQDSELVTLSSVPTIIYPKVNSEFCLVTVP